MRKQDCCFTIPVKILQRTLPEERRSLPFADKVHVIGDGAFGKGFECEDTQKLAFHAPHNIYAERGTLSFFWRSRYPVGPTEFPIFRVGFADHSSWDACWLRIDYSGNGFDAMITDANLSARGSPPRWSRSRLRTPGPIWR